jgi:hypothetical protein
VRVEVVLKDVGVGDNGAKMWVHSLAHTKIKLQKGVYELEDLVGKKAFSLNLPPKLGLTKKTLPTSFLNDLLESAWVESVFPYALLPH